MDNNEILMSFYYITYSQWKELLENGYEFELEHDKTNKMTCASREDAYQTGHLPSLIRVFAVRSLVR